MSLLLDRDVKGFGPEHRWGRWRVVDGRGLVGFVVESREWLGDTFGPSLYAAAHNPSGEPFSADWFADGFATPSDALGALADHVVKCAT